MMKQLKTGLLCLLLCGGPLAGTMAEAGGFQYTEAQLHYGDGYILGRNGLDETARTTLTLEHLTVGSVGEFFFFVDFFKDFDGRRRMTKAISMARSTAFSVPATWASAFPTAASSAMRASRSG